MVNLRSQIIGIDLGTTNTLASYYDPISGKGECCVNGEGVKLTPSVINFESVDSYIVGQEAKEIADIYPEYTAQNFKHLMGEAKEAIEVFGISYSPQQLSALILKAVMKNVKETLQTDSKDVIITVPAYFSNAARGATKEAGEIAGLNVVDIIDEPVSALYACDVLNQLEGKTILIFDLGGGTLDLVAAKITGEEIDEIAINGDIHLGGNNWDRALFDYIKNKYLGDMEMEADEEQHLLLETERAKKALSYRETTRITMHVSENRHSVAITREEFEKCTSYLLERTTKIVKELMTDLFEKGINNFDEVLLVGGSSRMPQIKKLLQDMFPFTNIISKDVDEAVAKGVAIYGELLNANENKYHVVHSFLPKKLVRISSRSYGLAAMLGDEGDEMICNIIYKGSELPKAVTKVFYTGIDGQKTVNLKVYETVLGKRFVELDEEYLLGTCVLKIDKEIPRHSKIFVEFTLNEDGTLNVKGKEPKSMSTITASMNSKALLDSGTLAKQKDEIDKLILL